MRKTTTIGNLDQIITVTGVSHTPYLIDLYIYRRIARVLIIAIDLRFIPVSPDESTALLAWVLEFHLSFSGPQCLIKSSSIARHRWSGECWVSSIIMRSRVSNTIGLGHLSGALSNSPTSCPCDTMNSSVNALLNWFIFPADFAILILRIWNEKYKDLFMPQKIIAWLINA